MKRSPIKGRNFARSKAAHHRNYGPEAEVLRRLPCAIATHGNSKHRCKGSIEIAHVIEPRGMGGCNSDRWKILQVCRGAHRGMGERGTTMFQAFELMFGVDLFALTDAAALEHPRPLGIRGLADRWVEAQIGSGSLSEVLEWQLEDYESDALRGWVTREMEREVERRGQRRVDDAVAEACSEEPDGDEPWDGLADNDREALSAHIAGLLGGEFEMTCKDCGGRGVLGVGETDSPGDCGRCEATGSDLELARALCEWATEGRWVS